MPMAHYGPQKFVASFFLGGEAVTDLRIVNCPTHTDRQGVVGGGPGRF